MMENEIASGINANATTIPASTSVRAVRSTAVRSTEETGRGVPLVKLAPSVGQVRCVRWAPPAGSA
jgi:hypothetical protein